MLLITRSVKFLGYKFNIIVLNESNLNIYITIHLMISLIYLNYLSHILLFVLSLSNTL